MLHTIGSRTMVMISYCSANLLWENTFLCRTKQNITGFQLVHTNMCCLSVPLYPIYWFGHSSLLISHILFVFSTQLPTIIGIKIMLLPGSGHHQQVPKWVCPNWNTANQTGNETRTAPFSLSLSFQHCNLNPSKINTQRMSLLFLHFLALILRWWDEKSVSKMAAKMVCQLKILYQSETQICHNTQQHCKI